MEILRIPSECQPSLVLGQLRGHQRNVVLHGGYSGQCALPAASFIGEFQLPLSHPLHISSICAPLFIWFSASHNQSCNIVSQPMWNTEYCGLYGPERRFSSGPDLSNHGRSTFVLCRTGILRTSMHRLKKQRVVLRREV